MKLTMSKATFERLQNLAIVAKGAIDTYSEFEISASIGSILACVPEETRKKMLLTAIDLMMEHCHSCTVDPQSN